MFSKESKQLPWIASLLNNEHHRAENSFRNNGYFFRTTIKPSTVKQAGNGRYTLDFIAANAMVSMVSW